VQEALEKAKECCGKNDLICVTGSLYLVAEAREIAMGKDKWSLVESKTSSRK
jgi:folylpolyglutamate synthase/dihydropteroate synthase